MDAKSTQKSIKSIAYRILVHKYRTHDVIEAKVKSVMRRAECSSAEAINILVYMFVSEILEISLQPDNIVRILNEEDEKQGRDFVENKLMYNSNEELISEGIAAAQKADRSF